MTIGGLDWVAFVFLVLHIILLILAIRYHRLYKKKYQDQYNISKKQKKIDKANGIKKFDYQKLYKWLYISSVICLGIMFVFVGINVGITYYNQPKQS